MNLIDNLPDGWSALSENIASEMEQELSKELCKEHVLYNQKVNAIARKDDRDDFLFSSKEVKGAFFVVHLTWSKETSSLWPTCTEFSSEQDFLNNWNHKLYE